MIRLMFYLTGLLIGLALAAAWGGRLSHLRDFAPELEPQWAQELDDDTGLMRGEIIQAVPGLDQVITAAWAFDRITTSGPLWQVTARGTGLTADADVTLRFAPGQGQVTNATGEITPEALPTLPPGTQLGGVLRLESGKADFDYQSGAISALSAVLRWQGAMFDGHKLGEGEMQVVSDQSGGWRAPFSLSGDLVTVTGKIEGRMGVGRVQLDVTIMDAGAMPAAWQQRLNRIVSRGEAGWVIRREIDLGQAGLAF